MLFGRSLFDSVLTRLEEETLPPEPREEESARIRGFTTGFVAPAMEGVSVSLHRIDGAYRDLEGDAVAVDLPLHPEAVVEEEIPPPLPAHLARQLPEEIAEDLGLRDDDSAEMLGERRRLFARTNHPDIVHAAHREAATLRMMTANLLVDRAMARLDACRQLGLI